MRRMTRQRNQPAVRPSRRSTSRRIAKWAIILGVVMISVGFFSRLLDTVLSPEQSLVRILALAAMGLITLGVIIGIAKSGIARRMNGLIVIGPVATLVGIYMTKSLVEGDISGVFIVGFVPVPMILVVPLVPLIGVGVFVAGIRKAFGRRKT